MILSLKDYVEQLLGEDSAQIFAEWAFGKGFEDIPVRLLIERWNAIHSDLFILSPDSSVKIDISKMITEWEKHVPCK